MKHSASVIACCLLLSSAIGCSDDDDDGGGSAPPSPSITGAWLLTNGILTQDCTPDTIEPGSHQITLYLTDQGAGKVLVELGAGSTTADFLGDQLDFTLETRVGEYLFQVAGSFVIDAERTTMTGDLDFIAIHDTEGSCAIRGPWDGEKYVAPPPVVDLCPSPGNTATSPEHPLIIGEVRGRNIQFVVCLGFPIIDEPGYPDLPGKRIADHFEFSIVADAIPGDAITLIWRNNIAEEGIPVVSILTQGGEVLLDDSSTIRDLPDGRTQKTIDLFTLENSGRGPLRAGTWILRTRQSSADLAVPTYDIIFDVPDPL